MTVIINTQKELEALIDDSNNIIIKDDLMINCSISIEANIEAWNIEARDIKARDIDAYDIKAWNIKARDIDARDITAINITAYYIEALNIKVADGIEAMSDIKAASDIKAFYIKAQNINAFDISIDHINAKNISYHTFCIARKSLICETIKGRRQNAVHLCLDQPIEYIPSRPTIPSTNIIVKDGI